MEGSTEWAVEVSSLHGVEVEVKTARQVFDFNLTKFLDNYGQLELHPQDPVTVSSYDTHSDVEVSIPVKVGTTFPAPTDLGPGPFQRVLEVKMTLKVSSPLKNGVVRFEIPRAKQPVTWGAPAVDSKHWLKIVPKLQVTANEPGIPLWWKQDPLKVDFVKPEYSNNVFESISKGGETSENLDIKTEF